MSEEATETAPNTESTGETTAETSYMDGRFGSITALEQGLTTAEKRYEDYRSMNDKRFGGFVGAPEEDYTFADGFESEDNFDNLREWGKENGLSNEAFQQLIEMSETDNSAQQEAFIAEQREALGKDADARIQNVVDWGRANLGEDALSALGEMVTTAKGVEMFEAIAKMNSGTAPAQSLSPKTTVDRDAIKSMRYAMDEYGGRKMSSDPQYRAKVEQMEADFLKGGGKL